MVVESRPVSSPIARRDRPPLRYLSRTSASMTRTLVRVADGTSGRSGLVSGAGEAVRAAGALQHGERFGLDLAVVVAHAVGDDLERTVGGRVLDELAQRGIALLATHGRLERHRLLTELEDLVDLLGRHLDELADLLGRRLAIVLLDQRPLRARHAVHPLNHVHGDPDRARLVRQSTRDRLPDPPGRVGRKLETATPVEL